VSSLRQAAGGNLVVRTYDRRMRGWSPLGPLLVELEEMQEAARRLDVAAGARTAGGLRRFRRHAQRIGSRAHP
jgi:hypothetical protein